MASPVNLRSRTREQGPGPANFQVSDLFGRALGPGQMSAAETRQKSAVETRQMYCIEKGPSPVSILDICLVSVCVNVEPEHADLAPERPSRLWALASVFVRAYQYRPQDVRGAQSFWEESKVVPLTLS